MDFMQTLLDRSNVVLINLAVFGYLNPKPKSQSLLEERYLLFKLMRAQRNSPRSNLIASRWRVCANGVAVCSSTLKQAGEIVRS